MCLWYLLIMLVNFLFSYTIVQIQCSKLRNHTGTHCRSRFSLLHEDKDITLEVIKLEFILKLKIKCNDWLLADSQSLCFILSLRLYLSFITSRPDALYQYLHVIA